MNRQERDELILKHLPYVKQIAARIANKMPTNILEYEDLVSAGTIGLIKAVDGWDTAKNNTFKTFAYRLITNAIFDEIKWLSVPSEKLSLLDAFVFDTSEDKLIKRVDILTVNNEAPIRVYEKMEACIYIKNILDSNALTMREKKIIQMYYFEDMTLKNIGVILGLTKGRVSQIKTNIIKNLNKSLKFKYKYNIRTLVK